MQKMIACLIWLQLSMHPVGSPVRDVLACAMCPCRERVEAHADQVEAATTVNHPCIIIYVRLLSTFQFKSHASPLLRFITVATAEACVCCLRMREHNNHTQESMHDA